MARLLLINGPNLNLLGQREPDIYGTAPLADIESGLVALAGELGHDLDVFQSNAEHAIVDRIHQAREDGVAAILINPGAYTHTSIAIRDALLGVNIAFYEVHLSNPHAREPFRRRSFLSDVAAGCLFGLGVHGYELALRAADRRLRTDRGH